MKLACSNPDSVKIIDFGLARDLQGMKDGKHNIKTAGGSTYYQAPEVLVTETGQISEKVDIWGTGCVLIYLCTGMPLFNIDQGCHGSQSGRQSVDDFSVEFGKNKFRPTGGLLKCSNMFLFTKQV